MRALNVIPAVLVLFPACVSQPTTSNAIWLDFSQSRLVRADQVQHYRCNEGLLTVERVSSGYRKIACGLDSTPALLR